MAIFRALRLAVLPAAVTALAAGAAPAPAAPFTCDASALSGSLLGQPAIEPITANRGAAGCRTVNAGGANALSGLPAPVALSVVGAATEIDGPPDRADQQTVLASGGITDLAIKALPDLPIALPVASLPAQAQDLTLPVPPPLNATLGPTVTIPIRSAVNAILPGGKLPTVELLRVQGAVAFAAASCADGRPKLAGASQVAGIKVLGVDTPLNAGVEQALKLIDTQNVDPSTIDVTALVPSLPGATPALQTALVAALRPAIQAALDAIPTISLPATLAAVRVVPGGQTTAGGKLTQRALSVFVAIAGQPIADLRVGEASAGAAGVDCTPPAPDPETAPATVPESKIPAAEKTASGLALQCSDRRLVLIDVLRSGSRVKLLGAADRRLAGRRVAIRFLATGRKVASARIARDGSFKTTAPLPAASLRATNRARYQAYLGKERSLDLKLQRRMIVDALRSAMGKVTIAGRVVLPLGVPIQTITLRRRVSCSKTQVVKRFKPATSGRFRVTVTAPKGVRAAVYRMQTRVRNQDGKPRLYPTFTLPRGVNLRSR